MKSHSIIKSRVKKSGSNLIKYSRHSEKILSFLPVHYATQKQGYIDGNPMIWVLKPRWEFFACIVSRGLEKGFESWSVPGGDKAREEIAKAFVISYPATSRMDTSARTHAIKTPTVTRRRASLGCCGTFTPVARPISPLFILIKHCRWGLEPN